MVLVVVLEEVVVMALAMALGVVLEVVMEAAAAVVMVRDLDMGRGTAVARKTRHDRTWPSAVLVHG